MKDIKNDLNYKVRQRYGLDKPVLTAGVLEFESYEAKLRMLLSPMYKFGKPALSEGLFHFFNNIEFFDCDFANVVQIKGSAFEKRTLRECSQELNELLAEGGYLRGREFAAEQAGLLGLGKLKHYPHF